MTNDMGLLDGDGGLPSISAAFLNPKGYLVDCPLSVADSLKTHLKLYKLRSKVKIKDATALYDVLVSGVRDPWQAPEREGGGDMSPAAAGHLGGAGGGREARFPDPRSAALGVRLIRPKGETGVCDFRDKAVGCSLVPQVYSRLRLLPNFGTSTPAFLLLCTGSRLPWLRTVPYPGRLLPPFG
ncbi:unnamed protein product [Ectocarpus sp. CCAP 1310/34]|nr:unnamed protein product [Ectocarpus sp. CCAP 1310/34]